MIKNVYSLNVKKYLIFSKYQPIKKWENRNYFLLNNQNDSVIMSMEFVNL